MTGLHGINILDNTRIVVVGLDEKFNFILKVRPENGSTVTKLNVNNFKADKVQPNHMLSIAVAFSYR